MKRSPFQRLLRAARIVAGECAGYLPLLGAFALFAHLCWFGLRPTLAERARLAQARGEWIAENDELTERIEELESAVSALADPMAQERLRRRIVNAGLLPAGEDR